MIRPISYFAVLLVTFLTILSGRAQEAGFVSLFDGKSLDGWKGDPTLWKAVDGMIVGESTAENPLTYNQFLQWQDGEVDDFELKVEFKIESGNSGIQIRSFERGKPNSLGGYQADIDAGGNWVGTNYGEGFRGVLAKRGQKTVINEEGKPEITGEIGDAVALGEKVKQGDWNEYHIIAKGFTITQKINGHTMSEVTDEDTDTRLRSGLLGFQLHVGEPMKVAFRNIRLKRLPLEDVQKVVLIAGKPSHPARTHEHNAGCLLLASLLNEHHGDKVMATVYQNGWPSDPTAFTNADAVVMFADGGQRHPAFFHLKKLADFRKKKIGVGAIHYAVEMLPGESNEALIATIGGAFEIDYSVNPHWTADFTTLPGHPVANGVKPFAIEDEWYFNMRFADRMKGVTPILSAVPPAETMSRADGHHSGNPEVRKMVAEGREQHLCWVHDRSDGGRGFGFTGGHYHDNWENDSIRTTVLNAISWIAGVEIPPEGISTPSPTKEELDANLDPKPAKKPARKGKKAKKVAK